MRQRQLLDRKRALRRLIRPGGHLLFAHHVTRGKALFEMACSLDLKGIVAKQKRGVYCSSAKWIKVKNRSYSQVEGRHELFEGRFTGRASKRTKE